MKRRYKILTLLLSTVLLASCGIFGGGDDDEAEPMELVKIDNKVKIKRLWSAKLGGDAEFLRVALRPAGDGNRVYAASHDGNVTAFNPETGKQLWRNKLGIELTAGPAVDGDLLVVASKDGYVIGLDAANGNESWRANVVAEILAAPVVKDDMVIVMTIDGRIQGLASYDGSQRWTLSQSSPALTIRGSSMPVVVGGSVIAGFDNGRLAAIDIDTGDIEWESLLAPPSGRSDLERLSDIDGAIAVVGQDVYASGYQGRLAAVAAESGQVLWAREISSFEGVSADWNNVYTVREDGEIVALTRRDGTESWRDASLLNRELTLPIAFDTTVVVGDLEGYLHFFSNLDGDPVARVKFGGRAITSDPVVMANRLYVQSDDGSIACFVIDRPKPKRPAPDIAEDAS